MPTEKKLTGYPSIDKPWLKYFGEKKIDFDIHQTIYSNFKKVAESYKENLALINFRNGQKLSFGELLVEADAFAAGLATIGIKKRSKVVALTFNSFIDSIALLGANKIGAMIEFLDPESDVAKLKQHASDGDAWIVEGVFQPLANLIRDDIPTIIYNCSKSFGHENNIPYSDFINNGKNSQSAINHDENNPAVIIFSSGSTGAPKPIVHSDFSVNCAIEKMLRSDFPLDHKHFMVKTIPSWIGLGVITSMLVALMAGMPQVLLGSIENSTFDFATCEPNMIPRQMFSDTLTLMTTYSQWKTTNSLDYTVGIVFFSAPIFFKFLLSQEQAISDMSFLKGILLGGSKMTEKELDLMDEIFRIKGLSVPIGIGYGQNELGGAVALNTVHHNKNGSAGYPVWKTVVKIVDRDTYEEVKYNEIGLILEKSDSTFLYYDHMPEETANTKIILSDGTQWYNSNDLGYIDEDGFLFITGRINRVVIKSDHKVSMDVVEAKIKGIEGIRDAAVVPSANGREDGDTIVFAVPENENMELSLERINDTKHGLTVFETPAKLVIVEELPRMNNGKVDYKALEKEAEKL